MDELLVVRELVKHFPVSPGLFSGRELGQVHAVDGISLEVRRGETLGLVGETGCGKTTTARLITRLIEPTSGQILYDGVDITRMSRRRLRPIRRELQMIFQDPYSSLNPRRPVGAIVAEPLRIHGIGTKAERRRRVLDAMDRVGLNPEHYNRYPHEFSGGQRQRVGIARAIVTGPRLIVADEPVSALDVSIRAQVLNLLQDLRDDLGLTLLFISHDLSVVRHLCDRVAVMYLGKIVELADPDRLYGRPKHPYTGALLSAVPVPNVAARNTHRLVLRGDVPSPIDPPPACRFHTRCPKAQELCHVVEPPLEPKGSAAQLAACHFPLTQAEADELVPPAAAA